MEQTYADILVGKESNADAMLSLFAICALTWTPELLATLNVTPTDAKVAFRSYCDLFITLLDSLSPPLAPFHSSTGSFALGHAPALEYRQPP